MAVQSYTVSAAAPTQPTSGSYALEIDNPSITVKGIQDSQIQFRLARDGNSPDATDVVHTSTGNEQFQLTAKTGHRLIIVGLNMTTGNDATVEIENG